ncbi:MAG: hypothetical protein R3E89_03145 [Thiolinea sp.]
MTVHKFNRLQDYIHYLEERPEELYELHDDILISVTSFSATGPPLIPCAAISATSSVK